MNAIKGMDRLTGILTTQQLGQLEKGAQRHLDQSNVTFSVLSVTPGQIEIEAAQGQSKSGKYASQALLKARAEALFGGYLPQAMLHITPLTFAPSTASTVTTSWLEIRMRQKGLCIKQIAFDTGINRESISGWVTGKKPMSQIVKAMFYYYLSK